MTGDSPNLLSKDCLLEISGLTLRPARETLLSDFALSVVLAIAMPTL
jgi:hypothetical protein